MTDTKIALVTGANKGIGLETCRQLAQLGIKVLMGARNEKRGTDAAGKLQTEGLDVEFLLLDVTNKDHIAGVRKYIDEKFGRLEGYFDQGQFCPPGLGENRSRWPGGSYGYGGRCQDRSNSCHPGQKRTERRLLSLGRDRALVDPGKYKMQQYRKHIVFCYCARGKAALFCSMEPGRQ